MSGTVSDKRFSRRGLFTELCGAGARLARGFTDEFPAAEQTTAPSVEHETNEGDFPFELLAMEAERLGLDPVKDREKIIRVVSEALGGFGTAGGGSL